MTTTSSPVRRFFTNPKTGDVVVAQPPNGPLWIFIVATAVRLIASPEGTAATAVTIIGTFGLVWWAIEEVFRGESPFRRVLGGAALVAVVVGRIVSAVS